MLSVVVKWVLVTLSLRCIWGAQHGEYVVITGQKEKQLNVTESSISSPRSRIECADWCLRNPWCVAATYMKNGGPNGIKCFPSSVRGGCLEKDTDAVLIKKKEVTLNGFKDCKELMAAGYVNDGSYRITPDGATEVDVVCDMTTTTGGWTTIQQRWDGSIDFYRGWVDYEHGFGYPTPCGNYWIGLKNIHKLTSTGTTELYVKLTSADGKNKYAQYSSFNIDDASKKYALHVSGYSGDAGDSLLEAHDGKEFSTFDNDNTEAGCAKAPCSITRHGAWWYRCCYRSHLNGEYLNTTRLDVTQYGMEWYNDLGLNSMMHTTMMLR